MTFRSIFPRRAATGAFAVALCLGMAAPLHAQMQYPDQGMQYPGQGGFGAPANEAGMAVRLNQLEEQVRQLNGQVEQMSHMLRQMEQRLGGGQTGGGYGMQGGGMGGAQPDYQQQNYGGPSVGGSGDGEFYGQQSEGGQQLGAPPQILGQIPNRPLDLSGALGGSTGGFGDPQGQGFGDQSYGGQGGTQLAVALSGNPRDDYDLAYGHILRGDFDTAEASFQQFLAHYPDDELAGNAQYWLGESLFARARYRDAADAFLAGYTEYPDNSKAPDNLFKLGMSLKELGERDGACASLAEIGRKYPQAAQAVRERARSEMDKSGC